MKEPKCEQLKNKKCQIKSIPLPCCFYCEYIRKCMKLWNKAESFCYIKNTEAESRCFITEKFILLNGYNDNFFEKVVFT